LVLRWEYIPGSELFLVWSQGTTNSGNPQEQLFPSLGDNLFSNKLENIFFGEGDLSVFAVGREKI